MKKKKRTIKRKRSRAPSTLSRTLPKSGTAIPHRITAELKKKLLTLREDILRTVRNKEAQDIASTDVGDEADVATQSLEKEMLFELGDNERTMLDSVEAALQKIEKGGFGFCEACRKPITQERLKAMPFARYCIQCQNTMERVG